jgi:hypothetical protein
VVIAATVVIVAIVVDETVVVAVVVEMLAVIAMIEIIVETVMIVEIDVIAMIPSMMVMRVTSRSHMMRTEESVVVHAEDRVESAVENVVARDAASVTVSHANRWS